MEDGYNGFILVNYLFLNHRFVKLFHLCLNDCKNITFYNKTIDQALITFPK